MTVKELCGIYYINKEIKALYEELADHRQQSLIKGVIISDMPKSRGAQDMLMEYTNKILEIEKLIECKLTELQFKRRKVEEFIEKIEDPELRLIIRLRAVNNMSWEEIGDEVGYHRTIISKKFHGYFKKLTK